MTTAEARAIQEEWRKRVIRTDDFGAVKRVAGVDVGIPRGNTTARAAVAILTYPQLVLCESVVVERDLRFPYVPGLLSFREVPPILDALEKLDTFPDLMLCDGQGLAHPRRFGLACHLGVVTDTPTIGVAKKRLIGSHSEGPDVRGQSAPLQDGEETIGVVLRTRTHVKPVFVSVGHRVGLDSAVAFVMACSPRYRLPETTRQAHRLASSEPTA